MFQLGEAQLITVSFYIVLPLLHPVKNVSPWPEVTKTLRFLYRSTFDISSWAPPSIILFIVFVFSIGER